MAVSPRKFDLWTLKFEFHVVFRCHKIFVFLFPPLPLRNVKTILSYQPYKNRRQADLAHQPLLAVSWYRQHETLEQGEQNGKLPLPPWRNVNLKIKHNPMGLGIFVCILNFLSKNSSLILYRHC